MIRKTLFGILFVCTAILLLSAFVSSVSASTLYVPDDYTTIQAAVDAAGPGDVIVVRDGTYKENVDVNKPHLTIKSENGADKTTVGAVASTYGDSVFEVTEDYVNIIGFTITGSRNQMDISLNIAHHCNIQNNNISSASHYGITLSESSINNIINNTITCAEQKIVISLSNSFSNNINNNIILGNFKGICLSEGSKNIISNNTVSYNTNEGIYISDSKSNIIRNNTVLHNGNGIDLDEESENNNITNNVVLHNKRGINSRSHFPNNICNNIVSSNSYGIYLGDTGKIHVRDNIVSDNSYGIYLSHSYDIIINDNNVSNSSYGIYLCDAAQLNTITNNNVTNSDEGIVLTYNRYSGCSENIISGNNVSDNTYGIRLFEAESNNITSNTANGNTYYGIYLSEGSSENIITQNTASNNYNGIYITESSDNICYLNIFANKADNVYSYKSTNTWNSTEKTTYIYKGLTFENYMGNYWSDYTGSDTNGDGIGDIPYHISTEASDMFPLMKKFEAYFTKTKPTKTSTPKLETIPIGGVGNNQEDSEVTHITTLHDADETGECFDFSQNTKIIVSRSGWVDYLAGTEGDLAFDSGRLVAQDETIPHLIVYKEEEILSKCKEMGVDDESWDRAKDQILSQIYGDLKLEEILIPETGYKKAVFPALQGLIYFIKCKDEKGYAVIRLLEISEEGLGMYKFEWIYYDTGMLTPTPTPTEGSIEEEIVTAKCGKITNWKTACTNVQLGGKFGAEMDFDNLMAGGYRFKGIVRVRSPTDEVYSGENQPRFVPSSPNNHGKFAGGNTLYVTIPEGASTGKYDLKLELWNNDTNELCDATEWKDDLFTVGQEDTDAVLIMHFDEGSGTVAKDSSSNSNDGTIYGAKWVDGVYGKALEFDGRNDYIKVPYSESLYIHGSFAIELWVYIEGNQGTYRELIGNRGSGTRGEYSWVMMISPDNEFKYWVGDPYSTYTTFQGKKLTTNTWYHVVFIRDAGVGKIYLNGKLDNIMPSIDVGHLTSDIAIGYDIQIDKYPFNGIIDEIRIYNRALSAEEIKTRYDEQEGGCGKITNWETKCQGVYSAGQKVGAEMEFESLMGGGYNFKGVIVIRSPTGDEYTNSEVEWVPSAPNPHGKFAAGDALYVTIPEGASAGNYDMKVELWNDDTDELCDETEWKENLFTVDQGITDAVLIMHFDEGSGTIAKDSSGYGNDGTIYGATWTTGVSGKALSFDGVNDYVDCGNDESLDITDAVTIAAWVNPANSGQGGYGRIVDKLDSSADRNGYDFTVKSGTPQLRVKFHTGDAGIVLESTDDSVNKNEWTHVAVTYDKDAGSNNLKIYINGLQDNQGADTDAIPTSSVNLRIGNSQSWARAFDGIIDEVRIYNRALTESEIRALYEQGGDTTPSNLLENTGFESGELDPWYSTKYYDPYKKCDWINIDVDSEARYEGDYGAYIDIRCSLDAWGRIIQEPVEITPGEKLAVEAELMYKGDLKDGYAELWLVFLDADKKSLDHVYKKYYQSDFGAEDKWLSAVLPATTAPSNAKYVRVMVGLADVKSCRLNIDDVILGVDSDADGLLDWKEEIAGTDPNLPDSDGDGLTDGQELNGWDVGDMRVIDASSGESFLLSKLLKWDRFPKDIDGDGDVGRDILPTALADSLFLDRDVDGDGDCDLDDEALVNYLSPTRVKTNPLDQDTDHDGTTDSEDSFPTTFVNKYEVCVKGLLNKIGYKRQTIGLIGEECNLEKIVRRWYSSFCNPPDKKGYWTEHNLGTDLDYDGDSIPLGVELCIGTAFVTVHYDPNHGVLYVSYYDVDKDGLSDYWEIMVDESDPLNRPVGFCGKKTLVFGKGWIPAPGGHIGATAWLDLADILGETEDGKAGWVTVWVGLHGGGDIFVLPIPIDIGTFPIDVENINEDPLFGPGLSLQVLFWDTSGGLHLNFQQVVLDVESSVLNFDIRREKLEDFGLMSLESATEPSIIDIGPFLVENMDQFQDWADIFEAGEYPSYLRNAAISGDA